MRRISNHNNPQGASAESRVTDSQISEDDARRALARAGHGGGYSASRVDGAWLFTPTMAVVPKLGSVSWVVSDEGGVVPLTGGVLSVRDALHELRQ